MVADKEKANMKILAWIVFVTSILASCASLATPANYRAAVWAACTAGWVVIYLVEISKKDR